MLATLGPGLDVLLQERQSRIVFSAIFSIVLKPLVFRIAKATQNRSRETKHAPE
jgi:predicted Kef-type K+ transport protein